MGAIPATGWLHFALIYSSVSAAAASGAVSSAEVSSTGDAGAGSD